MANPTQVSVFTDGSLSIQGPTSGKRYYLKSWLEMQKSLSSGSNFSAVTLYGDPGLKSGGQTNWVMLEEPEKLLWQRLNHAPYGSVQWNYFIRPNNETGSILIGQGPTEVSPDPAKWPCIAIGSKTAWDYQVDFSVYPRNQVNVLGWNANKTGVLVEGIKHGTNYDLLSLSSHPHLIHRVYCYYQGDGDPSRAVIGDTPKGILYMPLHDPASGYKVSLGNTGLWLDARWLHSPVSN